MKNWQKTLLMTALALSLTGCIETYYTKDCAWYEEGKLSCVKENLKPGVRCSETISRETQEWVQLMNDSYKSTCSTGVLQ
jgi:hypothetical protein